MARRKVAILTLFSTVFAPVLVVLRIILVGPVSSKQRVRRDNCRIGDIFIVRGFRSTVSERSAETVRFDSETAGDLALFRERPSLFRRRNERYVLY